MGCTTVVPWPFRSEIEKEIGGFDKAFYAATAKASALKAIGDYPAHRKKVFAIIAPLICVSLEKQYSRAGSLFVVCIYGYLQHLENIRNG